nr:hypothetical protein BaRGS_019577 [Batillaria attramentaria]
MSGTSLDGLDLCCVEFTGDVDADIWGYRVKFAKTVPYTSEWRERLGGAASLSGLELIQLHYDYAHYMGKSVKEFLKENELRVDFVATHGHTVFHQPQKKLTFQLGDGETLATYLNCPVVANFRAKDVAMGGQGAPLVPSGERFLYNQVALCVNLGGIANVGTRAGGAWDICPSNMVLNKLARMYDPNLQYDEDGEIARKGQVLPDLLASLENLEYYRKPPPKSLGEEWVNKHVWPLLDTEKYRIPDLLRTFVEHVTNRVAEACAENAHEEPPPSPTIGSSHQQGEATVLITGGGAHNTLLMNELRVKLTKKGVAVEKTDNCTVDFKEALVFAYLGLRCLLGKENVFAETTGARENCIAGSIHQPPILEPVVTSMHAHFRYLLRRQQSYS